MPSTNRLHRLAVAALIAAGAGLLGLAVGGMAGVDGRLQAASAPPSVARLVVERDAPPGACAPHDAGIADRPPRV